MRFERGREKFLVVCRKARLNLSTTSNKLQESGLWITFVRENKAFLRFFLHIVNYKRMRVFERTGSIEEHLTFSKSSASLNCIQCKN